MEPKVLSRKDDLGKYCFKHEYKLKSKNSKNVFNSCKGELCEEKTRNLLRKYYLFKKTYNANISTTGRNAVILLPTLYFILADNLLVDYGTLIHEFPNTRIGRKKKCICSPRTTYYLRSENQGPNLSGDFQTPSTLSPQYPNGLPFTPSAASLLGTTYLENTIY